jgi:anti-sigma B factor antagonist
MQSMVRKKLSRIPQQVVTLQPFDSKLEKPSATERWELGANRSQKVRDMCTEGRVIVMKLPEQLNGPEGKTFVRNLQPLFEVERPCLVLDCSQLQYMDNLGIDLLLYCMDEAMKRDGDLKLAALSLSSAAILELMRVDRLFEVFETAEEAARSFQAIASLEKSERLPWYAASYHLPNLKSAT